MSETVRKDLERLAYEYQILQERYKLLAQNLELLTLARNELGTMKETLEGLKSMEKEEIEVLIPIGGGSFLKGTIKDREHAIVSIGAGYAVEKDLEGAVKYIEERIKEYDDAIRRNEEALKQLEIQLQSLAEKAQNISRKPSQSRPQS